MMSQTLRWKTVTGVLLLMVLGAATAFAQVMTVRGRKFEMLPPVAPHFAIPPLVRFTGVLLPYSDQHRDSLHTLTVLVGRQKWLFQLDAVETLTEPHIGEMILNEIFPPVLHFTGPDSLLKVLQEAKTTGAQVTVEGRLYLSDRMLAVTAANEGAATAG